MSTKVSKIKAFKDGVWQDITKVHDGSGYKNFRGVYSGGVWYELDTGITLQSYDVAYFEGSDGNWTTARDQVTANDYSGGNSINIQNHLYYTGVSNVYIIERTIFKLDTSSITSGYTSAVITFNITSYDSDHSNYVYIQKHTDYNGSDTDYDAFDKTLFTTNYGDGNVNSDGSVSITLNSDFITDAENNNVLNIGIRNSLDYENTAPTSVEPKYYDNTNDLIEIEFS